MVTPKQCFWDVDSSDSFYFLQKLKDHQREKKARTLFQGKISLTTKLLKEVAKWLEFATSQGVRAIIWSKGKLMKKNFSTTVDDFQGNINSLWEK